jgi:hypothetical protein
MIVLFADKNPSLVSKVAALFHTLSTEDGVPYLGVVEGEVKLPFGVLVSASNPDFTMGGGWDACIVKWFPFEVFQAQQNKGKNQRIGDVIFTVTVGRDLRATKELVEEALRFALSNVKKDELLVLTGLGTGIGGLSEDTFVALLESTLHESAQKFEELYG